MSKSCALAAAALIAFAGSASASTILVDNPATYTVSTAADNTTTFALPARQSAGVVMDFTFSFTGTLQNNDYFGMWFGNSTGPSFGLKANCGGDVAGCTNDLYLRMGGTGGTYLANSNLVAGTDYHLMGYLYKTGNSANYNGFSLWLNPSNEEMRDLTGADLQIAGAAGFASLTSVGFRTVNIDNGVVLSARDIRVGSVPEPGTLSLMGLAVAGFGLLRRRKSA